MSAAFAEDDECWCPEPEHGFVRCTVVAQREGIITVQAVSGQETADVPAAEVYTVNPPGQDGCGDLTELMYCHTPHMLHNLRVRSTPGYS